LLCDPYNANDLASKIGRYLSEPQWAVSVGNRAQRIARERFSMAQCVSQSVAFYQTLLSKTKSAAREE